MNRITKIIIVNLLALTLVFPLISVTIACYKVETSTDELVACLNPDEKELYT